MLVVGLIVSSLIPESGILYRSAERVWGYLGPDGNGPTWLALAAFLALIYVLTAVAVFFNVALVHCALRCHSGRDPSIRAGLGAAASRLPQILGWALVAATVGVLLQVVDGVLRDKLGFLGSLLGGLLDFGWSVTTYLVLPVLAAEGVGPVAAVRRSSAILRSKWGETLAGQTRFGLFGVLFFLQAAALFFLGLALETSGGATVTAGIGVLLMAAGVLYGLAALVAFQALGAIFQTAVYLVATTGQAPPGFDPALVGGAFRPKA